MADIDINGKRYELRQFTGKVMQANKHLETQVRGGGGGGFTYQGTGGSGAVSISSTTVTHDDVFLQNAQGREHVLRLKDWDVACREGHEIRAAWLRRDGKDSDDYLLVQNLTTSATHWAHRPFARMFRLFEPTWVWMALSLLPVLFMSGTSMLLTLALLGLPVWLWMHNQKARRGIAQAKQELLAQVERESPGAL